jgi:STE24 endopeptidase
VLFSTFQVKLLLYLVYGFYPFLWSSSGQILHSVGYSHEILQSIIFFLIETYIDTLFSIPFSYISTFIIEQKHGFNKQTMNLFIVDLIKSIILTTLIGTPIVALLIAVIEWGGKYF